MPRSLHIPYQRRIESRPSKNNRLRFDKGQSGCHYRHTAIFGCQLAVHHRHLTLHWSDAMATDSLPELVSFIETLAEPRILVDLDYRILAANQAYRDTYSPRESVIGRRCYEVSHHYARPCDEVGESCPRRQALQSRRGESALHVHHTPRGDEHVQVELNPVRGADGAVRFFVERMQSVPTAGAARSVEGIVGRSPSFRSTLALVARVAPTDTSVLVLGETGTGKEMIARAVHSASGRAGAPFVAVDCSGLSGTLFESELFGHEKGAFTGATHRKTGLVEAASGGTLFLDEIGDIPLGQQVKLLRLIENNSYRRVGSVTPLRADFRLIAATHRDLKQMVSEGAFRSDLYYRISAFPILVPALRDRRDDVLLLAESLLARLRPDRTFSLSAASRRALITYDYPGNVRELRNIVERASLLATDACIEPEHLPKDVTAGRRGAPAGATGRVTGSLRTAERDVLARALAEHGGNRRELAVTLGLSERTLYRKLRAHGLSAPRRALTTSPRRL
jgi:two-component system response regulator HydG